MENQNSAVLISSYTPRGDRVLVDRLERPSQAPGSMALPKSQERPFNEGIVIAVGPGMRNRVSGQVEPLDLTPGEHICFLDFAGVEVEVDGKTYISMREDEIHGKRK